MAIGPDMAIDLNRGVRKQIDQKSGIEVYMYKDSPGAYYDRSGNELDEKIAKRAGFDIESLKKRREKMEKMQEAIAKIEEEYGDAKRFYEKGGLKTLETGPGTGKFKITDRDGNPMSEKEFSFKGAKDIIDSMASSPKE